MREKTISIKMATAAIVSLVLGALLLIAPVSAADNRVPALSGEKSSVTVKFCYVDGSRSVPIAGARMACALLSKKALMLPINEHNQGLDGHNRSQG